MGIPINTKYRPLYTSPKRYFLLTGGRGSLKTSTVQDYAIRLTEQRGQGILFTRYTMRSAEISIIPGIRATLARLGVSDRFQITKNRVVNKETGSFILFTGIKTNSGDQTATLKSIEGITTWIVEEGQDFTDESAFDIIDDSIRAAHIQNRVIWIQNPTTREHFIYKRFIEPANKRVNVHGYDVTISTDPRVCHIHTTYKIAEKLGYLAPSFLAKIEHAKQQEAEQIERVKNRPGISAEQIEKESDTIRHTSFYYYNYIGGWLERPEGAVFPNWSERPFRFDLPGCFFLDFGYYPDPLAVGQITVDKKRREMYVRQLIYATEINDIPAALHSAGIPRGPVIVADTNEPRTLWSIKKKGYNIRKAVKRQIVTDIREINSWNIFVDPDSAEFKAELLAYIFNDKRASIPIDDFNHLLDGMRYGYNFLVNPPKSGVSVR